MADDSSSSFDDFLNNASNPLSTVDQPAFPKIPKYDAPTPYQLNPADSYKQSLHYGGLAADQSSQTATNATAGFNAANQQAYANKKAIDNQYAQQGKMQTGSAGDGSSSTFSVTTPNSSGQPNNITQSVQNAQQAIENQKSLDNNTRYNQSLLAGQQYSQQSNLQSEQDKSNEKIAGIQSQGNVLSSLFSSVGGQKYSPQYW